MQLCRLCYSELSLNLFRTIFNKENEPPFLDIIKKLTDIDISESDPYSKIMCIKCYDKLVNVYDFFKIIKETDSKFRHNFNNNSSNNKTNEKNVLQLEIKQEMDCETDEHAEIDSSVLNEPKLIDYKTEIDIDDCFAAMIKEEIDGPANSDKEKEENCLTVEMDENTISSNDEINCKSTITLDKNSKIPTFENVTCKICKKTFKHKNNLSKHQKTHGKLSRCHICKAILTSLHELEEHKRFHSTNKPHECSMCKRTFRQKRNLLKHLKTHLYDIDEKPLKCGICDQQFSLKTAFRRHKKTHEDNLTYECDICDKAFIKFIDLRNHKLEHCDQVYECKVCGKKYTNKAVSLKHLKEVHFGKKKYQCDLCGENFSLKSLLTNHVCLHKDKILTARKEIANSSSENSGK